MDIDRANMISNYPAYYDTDDLLDAAFTLLDDWGSKNDKLLADVRQFAADCEAFEQDCDKYPWEIEE